MWTVSYIIYINSIKHQILYEWIVNQQILKNIVKLIRRKHQNLQDLIQNVIISKKNYKIGYFEIYLQIKENINERKHSQEI